MQVFRTYGLAPYQVIMLDGDLALVAYEKAGWRGILEPFSPGDSLQKRGHYPWNDLRTKGLLSSVLKDKIQNNDLNHL
jgi:hypothetical protein